MVTQWSNSEDKVETNTSCFGSAPDENGPTKTAGSRFTTVRWGHLAHLNNGAKRSGFEKRKMAEPKDHEYLPAREHGGAIPSKSQWGSETEGAPLCIFFLATPAACSEFPKRLHSSFLLECPVTA